MACPGDYLCAVACDGIRECIYSFGELLLTLTLSINAFYLVKQNRSESFYNDYLRQGLDLRLIKTR